MTDEPKTRAAIIGAPGDTPADDDLVLLDLCREAVRRARSAVYDLSTLAARPEDRVSIAMQVAWNMLLLAAGGVAVTKHGNPHRALDKLDPVTVRALRGLTAAWALWPDEAAVDAAVVALLREFPS